MKEPNELIQQYINADRLEKESILTKKSIKPKIVEELKDDPKGTRGISYQSKTLTKINHENFYLWVKQTYPERLLSLLEDKIDYEKFETAYAKGEIFYDEIPENCYTIETQDVITVTKG